MFPLLRLNRSSLKLRTHSITLGSGLVALSLSLCVSSQARAGYVYTTLDAPGSTLTQAFGINDSGQIVGSYRPADGIDHGFLLRGGTYTPIDVPGAYSSPAFGINDSGQ